MTLKGQDVFSNQDSIKFAAIVSSSSGRMSLLLHVCTPEQVAMFAKLELTCKIVGAALQHQKLPFGGKTVIGERETAVIAPDSCSGGFLLEVSSYSSSGLFSFT